MRIVLLLLLIGTAVAASAQGGSRLTTFVDCPGYVPGCDLDFFQTEVGFARFVRDPTAAEAYVLIVDQDTGGGGQRYTLYFEGRRGPLAGRRDTLVASAPPAASDDDQRRVLLGRLALGLAGLASRTGLADRLSVSYEAPAGGDAEAPAEPTDPWNSWVFEIDGRAFFEGQSRSREQNLFGAVSARRVTDALKVAVRPRISYNRNEFDITDDFDDDGDVEDSTFVSDNTNYGVRAEAVVSLTDHWSAGLSGRAERATFSNYDLRARLAPAIEYNLYPYDEATRRQVRLFYSNGAEAAVYQDTTIFLKTEELLWVHETGVAAEFAQPWGSVDLYAEASQYLSRPDKYSAGVGGGLDLRLLQGLNLRLDGNYRFVRDQINLPAEDPSSNEVLTQNQELATGFSYFASVGLSYTFGSIYNQVVNARFGG